MGLISNTVSTPIMIITYSLLFSLDAFSQFERLSQSFDLLSTIAGKGGKGDGDENLWLNEYEGAKATDAVLSGPHMAMADSMGNVYIADKNAHAIRKIDTRGIITTFAGINKPGDGKEGAANTQALSGPNGLWVNKAGVIYILDLWNNKIRRVDLSGNMTTIINDTAKMSAGRGLWVSHAEDTIWYCSGTVIKMWTAENGLVNYSDGFSGDLGNIVQDRNGNILATDRSANLVYRINKAGQKTVIAGNGKTSGGGDGFPALETAFYGVRGIWVLEDNTYFLATHEGSQVWYVDSAAIAHLFIYGKEGDENHSGDGMNYRSPGYKVSEVRAITADFQGNLLITENDRGYIRRVDKKVVSILKNKKSAAVKSLTLYQDFSSGITRMQFSLPCSAMPQLIIQNLLGQSIRVPFNYRGSSEIHEYKWNSRDLAPGTFLITILSDYHPVLSKQFCISH